MVSDYVQKLLLSSLIGLWLSLPAAARSSTYLVFPLENQSKAQSLGWIGEGIAIAISEEIHTPGVDAIGWDERVRFIESSDLPPNAPLSRASMIRVGQKAAADRLVFGTYSGTEDNLRIVIRVLEMKTLRVSGEKVANGPASALPQLENELAWEVLSDGRSTGVLSRADFRARTRTVPNKPYAGYIACLPVTDEGERAALLLRTLESYRDFPQASFQLGFYYYEKGDFPRAIQYLRPALKETQDFLEAEFMLGTAFLRLDNPTEAVQAYSAVAARTQAMEVFNNLGVAYLRKGDYPLAVQNLIEARKLARTDSTVALNLAVLRHAEGDETAALVLLEDLIKTHPEQGMVHYLYSLALSSQGQQEKATMAMAQAQSLGVDPEKMKRQDPRTWARVFPAWTHRPSVTQIGSGAGENAPGSDRNAIDKGAAGF